MTSGDRETVKTRVLLKSHTQKTFLYKDVISYCVTTPDQAFLTYGCLASIVNCRIKVATVPDGGKPPTLGRLGEYLNGSSM